MAEVVSTGVSHMCDNSTVSVNSPLSAYLQEQNFDHEVLFTKRRSNNSARMLHRVKFRSF